MTELAQPTSIKAPLAIRILRYFIYIFILIVFVPAIYSILSLLFTGPVHYQSAKIAPFPDEHKEAVLQVYGAKLYGIRGLVGIHTWVSTKEESAQQYMVHQVVGWRHQRGHSALEIKEDFPDRHWYGNKPFLIHDVRGETAKNFIKRLNHEITSYPHANEYTLLPGPNSNSFTAWVGLVLPELKLELPMRAIGKNWMEDNFDRYRHKATNTVSSSDSISNNTSSN